MTDGGVLSCYTANLAAYLAGDFADARARIAGTVRLAVRTDSARPEFSHHAESLATLPDGGHLAYRCAARVQDAMSGIVDELDRHGRVLVVANSGMLPWAPGDGASTSMHWLLVDGRKPEGFHVVDEFEALLPEGEQHPHTGWLPADRLAHAIAATAPPSVPRRSRDAYAFGFPVPVPAADRPRWLARVPGPGPAAELPGDWVYGADALAHLAAWFGGTDPDAATGYEDLWTAARHHEHKFAWQAATGQSAPAAAEHATQAWWQLVRSLRFALESGRRGRARPTLIDRAFRTALELAAGPPEESR